MLGAIFQAGLTDRFHAAHGFSAEETAAFLAGSFGEPFMWKAIRDTYHELDLANYLEKYIEVDSCVENLYIISGITVTRDIQARPWIVPSDYYKLLVVDRHPIPDYIEQMGWIEWICSEDVDTTILLIVTIMKRLFSYATVHVGWNRAHWYADGFMSIYKGVNFFDAERVDVGIQIIDTGGIQTWLSRSFQNVLANRYNDDKLHRNDEEMMPIIKKMQIDILDLLEHDENVPLDTRNQGNFDLDYSIVREYRNQAQVSVPELKLYENIRDAEFPFANIGVTTLRLSTPHRKEALLGMRVIRKVPTATVRLNNAPRVVAVISPEFQRRMTEMMPLDGSQPVPLESYDIDTLDNTQLTIFHGRLWKKSDEDFCAIYNLDLNIFEEWKSRYRHSDPKSSYTVRKWLQTVKRVAPPVRPVPKR